ncbi:CvfB family protein [Clostridium formicaceticum]|uniref:RNA-binding protein n=1 Tax=Clostridium formicaceticum TaxID=1497 RepID=A0AAC9WHC1_9CLOT|nr:S1-like domain-containing RNA-binding protein [Clostridium formicaceticum]AOY78121.1 RNA-binding protein [Clostridium formicaceticum]ARE88771.1 hypothetical protein CLFO_31770 [Clostridium formicaceticum]
MIELGEVQKLEVVKFNEVGTYLSAKKDKHNSVLLPKKQVPEGLKIGDEIEVFIYRDSEDRLIATTKKPKIKLGELAFLSVVEVTKIGAFLDWGLEKDLFLPFKEQKGKMQKGREYLVGLYIDKSDRLCATMDIHKLLSSESPYKKDDRVRGRIYGINKDIGAFVAVDNKYQALIPKNELYGEYEYGDEVEARVAKVKEDGKLDLSLREKAHKQMDEDVKVILDKLKLKDGFLLLNDNSDPNKIKKELNMSKRAFKRAIGRLLKEGSIHQDEKGIKIIDR